MMVCHVTDIFCALYSIIGTINPTNYHYFDAARQNHVFTARSIFDHGDIGV